MLFDNFLSEDHLTQLLSAFEYHVIHGMPENPECDTTAVVSHSGFKGIPAIVRDTCSPFMPPASFKEFSCLALVHLGGKFPRKQRNSGAAFNLRYHFS